MASNLQVNNTSFALSGKEAIVLSLLIPFEPKITAKAKIEANIRHMVEQSEEQLRNQSVPQEQVEQVMKQLHMLLSGIEYNNQKKSIAIMVTPEGGRLQYWNMEVLETILVSNEFEVRQLATQKRIEKEYLLLAIGDHFGGIYLGKGARLSRLVANSPSSDAVSGPEHFSNIENAASYRAVRHLDNALSILRRSYRYPVFVIAPGAYLQSFKEISRNATDAAALIEANPQGNDARLQQLLAPYLADWQSLTEKSLVQQLERSQQSGKLVTGITEVWTAASEKRGRLLAIEEDYTYSAYLDAKNGVLYADAIPLNKEARKATDAVAVVIEKVLVEGGCVEFVRKGTLEAYGQVALITY